MTFSAKSTAAEVAQVFEDRCKGKVVLVTGANTGLGLETARVLAGKGCHVIVGSRNPTNGENAVTKIKQEFPNANVSSLVLNLSSLKDIKVAADTFLSQHSQLHLLINNAGIMACPKALTADGYESQFAVNHLAHFYLTQLLMPLLISSGTAQEPSRVINLSSMANYSASNLGINFDDINGEKRYVAWERYGHSKLANILFAAECNKRYQSQNVISVSLHPGVIAKTELSRNMNFKTTIQMIKCFFSKKGGFSLTFSQRMKSIPEGTATTILAALDPTIVPGAYYYDCKKSEGEGLHPMATNPEVATKLWELSEKMVADALKK